MGCGCGHSSSHIHSESNDSHSGVSGAKEILDDRLARGEITQEEYKKLKEVIEK